MAELMLSLALLAAVLMAAITWAKRRGLGRAKERSVGRGPGPGGGAN